MLARRLAREKAERALAVLKSRPELEGAFIVAADTVVARGSRILPKPEHVDEAAQCLRLLSGRGHRVYTGLTVVTPKGAFRDRLVETRVSFKHLSTQDIESLPRLGRVARQGGRLRHPGPGRRVRHQARRLLPERGGPAALRDHGHARRRGLSGARIVAERGVMPPAEGLAERGDGADIGLHGAAAAGRRLFDGGIA